MRRTRGFSLIELLIVVAIILVIAAIAVPSFLRSRIVANESAAVGSLRTLNTAQISYLSSYPTVGYAATLGALAGTSCNPPSSGGACLIDTALAQGVTQRLHVRPVWRIGFASGAYQGRGQPDVDELLRHPLFLLFSGCRGSHERCGHHDLR